ncbi:MAG TPA: hypothetical protein DCS07_10495 [Bdellovibrionales bacterium]|nr:hypothetical protein [Bdellovibrionales bacterium]
MYSPIRTELKLENSYGQEVASRISHPVYEGDSGFANFDAFLTAELPEPGDYFLSVTGMNMSSSMYPAGPMLLDGTPFVVLSGSLNDPTPNLAPDIPNNARCRMSEAFAQYSSPAGDPPRSSRDKDSGGVGFCGTVDTDAKRLKGDSMPGFESGASPFAIVAWFLPWLFMALIRMILLLGQRYRLARSPVDS